MILPTLFTTTIFVSAALLFSVQPILAKLLLPLLGGSPAVWTTCMVFFQGMLLAGYAYAHLVSNRLGTQTQCAVHLALLAGAALALPLGVSDNSARSLNTAANPAGWLLLSLLTNAGLPFFVVSTSAPLLQRWFSETRHPSANDPYFLYAASNLGSLIALFSYPLVVEPNFRLQTQSQLWAAAFGLLILLFLGCMLVRLNPSSAPSSRQHVVTAAEDGSLGSPDASITAHRRFLWVALAFVPSSLMLGVTAYLTADVASVPLLWVLPLSLYLLTFVLAFAKRPMLPTRFLNTALPIGGVGLAYLLLSEATEPAWLLILLHLVFFFVAAAVCHARLVSERPPPSHLTEFYLWLSVGGVLGGLFNALVAPTVFNWVIEYPIAIILACVLGLKRAEASKIATTPTGPLLHPMEEREDSITMVQPSQSDFQLSSQTSRNSGNQSLLTSAPTVRGPKCESPSSMFGLSHGWDLVLPMMLGLITATLAVFIPRLHGLPAPLSLALVFGVPLVVAYTFVDRSLRFGLGLAAVFLAGALCYSGAHGETIHKERNFFGVLRVTLDPERAFRRLVHGNTVHGRQFIDPARQSEPLSYYHRSGPLGQVFRIFDAKPASTNVAVVGLGAGTMACYAKPHQMWTYYEINPAVIRFAQNTNYFTFLSQSLAAEVRVVVGDARLRIREAPDGCYNLILLDAFSSDAIPMHLITREALAIYVSKLADGGVLAFHISNRCLDLQPVLGDLAGDAGLVCYAHDEIEPSPDEIAEGKDQSHWVVIARQAEDVGRLVKDSRWQPIEPRSRPQVWTDDFSNIIGVFRWR